METLALLFDAIISAEAELHEKREQLGLSGDRLFETLDVYKMGYVSTHALAAWVGNNCGFTIKDSCLDALQRRFSKKDKHRITREQFSELVSSSPDEEEDEEDKASSE